MIIKAGKINKARGNIVLTIGKEDVNKHNLEDGDFIILTSDEYEDLKASSEIEVSTMEVIPDDEAVIKLEYDLKEAKSKEKILFSKVEELEKLNLELTTELSKIEKENYINKTVLTDSESGSLLEEIKNVNDKNEELNSEIKKLNKDLKESDEERIELLQDMNVLKTKMSFDAGEISRLRERESKYREVLEIILKSNKNILDEAVNKTVTATIHEINKELSQTGLIRRIRGLTIVREPEISKESISSNAYKQLEGVIPDEYFLDSPDE
ncbi:hypothetical protein mru_0731 [Methanobrevibacter ruminantium M1]|uniref:Uncharacterized protein n=1 Tax=Methanobrevibacter ruminantium (strain ATCC 35063 / DSM 1093 / JCM 13430 / OCM 146 / M1) TaxID=634498 RepID=D3E221_METRM|nr:hypothetical protein [Methanobrevibacter ruminantium]ADC46582.1 hypothetical protein mru_0731 [Methanobrevibacter ruminantium M1]